MSLKGVYALILALAVTWMASTSSAAERCEGIFASGPYHELALGQALKKKSSLSSRDLDLLVEKVFTQKEGPKYRVSDYWKKNADQRVLSTLERELGEAVTRQGLLKHFEDNNLLIDRSRLMTKLIAINRSPSFNVLSAVWASAAALKGAAPVFLPEASFKIKTEDLNTLLLKGTDSVEGKALIQTYKVRLEANRAYDVFSRYYTRVALVALIYIIYDKAQDLYDKGLPESADDAFEELIQKFEKALPVESELSSKEDVLFATVLQNFKKKFNRLPDEQELYLICAKIYKNGSCKK